MLSGKIALHEAFKEDFDKIKSFLRWERCTGVSFGSVNLCGLGKTKKRCISLWGLLENLAEKLLILN